VVSVVSDYAPGIDVETAFKQRFEAVGGKGRRRCACRSPIRFSDVPEARCRSHKPEGGSAS